MEDVVNITEPPGLESDKDVQTLLAYLQRCVRNKFFLFRNDYASAMANIIIR